MIKFYNTLTNKKEILKPLKDKKIELFVCGPTVYDFSHIGHARTYIVFDAITTYLREIGYDVFYLQNITDIDDKIIKRAKENNKSPKEIAERFEKEYYNDMSLLKVNNVSKYAKATEHIKEIQNQVERLIKKGFAYQIEDGIYYDIKKFKDYGKLSGRTLIQAEDATSRIDNSSKKKNKGDFCLWKISKKNEPKWPFNKLGIKEGRPGWHIEDTAITEKYFGSQYDIHGGARDLIFPHHEAEIAQMEAISGEIPLVKYWLHTGFLTINGQKMAKSLGNFITIRGFLKKYSAEVLRFFIFSSHYRSPIDYSEKAIFQAKESLQRLCDFKNKIEQKRQIKKDKNLLNSSLVKKINKKLEDDFNTPEFFSSLFDIVKKTNRKINQTGEEKINNIYQLLLFTNKVFKIFPKEEKEIKKKIQISTSTENIKINITMPESGLSKKIENIAIEREKCRYEKNWSRADALRKQLEQKKILIEDTPDGPRLKKK